MTFTFRSPLITGRLQFALLWNAAFLLLLVAASPSVALAQTAAVTVPGTANVYNAGLAAPDSSVPDGPGTLPVLINVPAGGGVVTFPGVTGGVFIDINSGNGGNGANPGDGGPYYGPLYLSSLRGLSGLSYGLTGPLIGVFLSDADPAASAPPPNLDFTPGGLGVNFTALFPVLGQVFFIGDGKTADGTLQHFNAPPGATRLFLGVGDGGTHSTTPQTARGFGDNGGAFTVTYSFDGGDGSNLFFSLPLTTGAANKLDLGAFEGGRALTLTFSGTGDLVDARYQVNPDGSLAAPATGVYAFANNGAAYPTINGGDGINHFPGGGANYDASGSGYGFAGSQLTDTTQLSTGTNAALIRNGAAVGTFSASPGRGDWFLIGNGATIQVPPGGAHLYVAVNDTVQGDNHGAYAGTLKIGDIVSIPDGSLVVPGTANIWLAGAAAGTTASSGQDTLANAAPFRVTSVALDAGSTLNFSATGSVSNDPARPVSVGPDGGAFLGNIFAGHSAENGIAPLVAPYNSLVGVFLDDSTPSGTPPAGLDFSGGGNPGDGVSFANISPALRQPFFIGDGQPGNGGTQGIVVPAGATRLYLGSFDPSDNENNVGQFNVKVTVGAPAPTPSPSPSPTPTPTPSPSPTPTPTTLPNNSNLTIGADVVNTTLGGGNAGGNAQIGDRLTYTFHVSNTGKANLTNAVVLDLLPNGLQFVSASNGGHVNANGFVEWDLGTLKPNAPSRAHNLTLVTKVVNTNGSSTNIGAKLVNNNYSVSVDDYASSMGRDILSTIIKGAVLVTLDSNATSVSPGGQIIYKVHVAPGDTGATAHNVQVSVPLPQGVNFVSAAFAPGTRIGNKPPPAPQVSSTGVLFNLGDITARASGIDLLVTVQVPYDVLPAAAIELPGPSITTRVGNVQQSNGTLPPLDTTLSGQPPSDPPALRLYKLVPDSVETSLVLGNLPAAVPFLTAAFPGIDGATDYDALQRFINPYIVVGTDSYGGYQQQVLGPNLPGGPTETYLTYALLYYNASATNAAPNGMLVDRVPEGTTYVPGSAFISGKASDPAITDDGRTLTFNVGTLPSTGSGGSPRLGLITYKVRILAPGESGALNLGSTIAASPAFLSTPALVSRVASGDTVLPTVLVAPAHGVVTSFQLPATFTAGSVKEYHIVYKNDGGLPAQDFQFADSFPAGATFLDATSIRGRAGQVSDLNAASHSFTYHLGAVQPGESGEVRLRVRLTTAATTQPGLVGIHSAVLLPAESFGAAVRGVADDRTPTTRGIATASTRAAATTTNPLGADSNSINVSRSDDSNLPRPGICLTLPVSVKEGDTFDVLIAVTNSTEGSLDSAGVVIPIPDGVNVVNAEAANDPGHRIQVALNGNDDGKPAVRFFSQSVDSSGQALNVFVPPHGSILRRVTFQASVGSAGKALTFLAHTDGATSRTGSYPVAIVYTGTASTYVYSASQPFDATLKGRIVASALATQGLIPSALSDDSYFQAQVNALTSDASNTVIGGLDGIHLNNGGFITKLGPAQVIAIGPATAFSVNAGALVAAGGGNLVAAGGGNLVAAGGGNLIELTNLVAAGGGNLVAAGGGNLTALSALNSLVAAGGGNLQLLLPGGQLVAAGGGNLVAAGGGNLVAAGGGNIISHDGGGLISQDGGGVLSLNLADIISHDGGGFTGAVQLISQDGAGIISHDGGGIISHDGGGIISHDGGGIISHDGGGIISDNSAGLLTQRGGNVLAVGGGGLLSDNGIGLVSSDAGHAVMVTANGLVAAGGGNLVAAGGGN